MAALRVRIDDARGEVEESDHRGDDPRAEERDRAQLEVADATDDRELLFELVPVPAAGEVGDAVPRAAAAPSPRRGVYLYAFLRMCEPGPRLSRLIR